MQINLFFVLFLRDVKEKYLNNIKINDPHQQQRHNLVHQKYKLLSQKYPQRNDTKRIFFRHSLENVASNPIGNSIDVLLDTNLKRTKSLALIGPETKKETNIRNNDNINGNRRSQLIPRAKLIDRSQESLYHHHQHCIDKIRRTLREDIDDRHVDVRKKRQVKLKKINSFPSRSQEEFVIDGINAVKDKQYSSFSSFNLYERGANLIDYDDDVNANLNNYGSIGDDLKTIVTYDANISLSQNANLFNDDKKLVDGKIKTIRGDRITYPIKSYDTINLNDIESDNSSDFYSKESFTQESVNSTLESINSAVGEVYNEDKARVISIEFPSDDPDEENIYDALNNTKERSAFENASTSFTSSTPSIIVKEKCLKVENRYEELSVTENLSEDNPQRNESNLSISTDKKDVLTPKKSKELIKTSIQVPGFDKVIDEYKTIITVDHSSTNNLPTDVDKCNSTRKHSHNYLREFLASHKGSRNPLQNFLSKKFSRAFHAKPAATNLIQNHYHSLPDINASKNLQKCENINKKLQNNTNRFIINIGNNLEEFSTNKSYPEHDFELKISKIVPNKKNRNKNSKNKSQIVTEVCKETRMMDGGNKNEEFKQKIDNMRNYWSKITGNNYECEKDKLQEEEIVENVAKCKIIDVQEKKNMVQNNENKPKFALNCKITNNSTFFSNPYYENQYESLNPNGVEIVENGNEHVHETRNIWQKNVICKQNDIGKEESVNSNEDFAEDKDIDAKETISRDICKEEVSNDKPNLQTTRNIGKDDKKMKKTDEPEFDYVRYRVIKSDLFQKKIFANCENKSEFDDLLMQYLQNYSFQELLIGNNVVIIEPIRFCVQNETKTTPNDVTSMLHKSTNNQRNNSQNNSLRRHFFYHPVRVNREIREDELPNPDTVKQARNFFECELTKRTQSPERLNRIRRDSFRYSSDDSSLKNAFNFVTNNDDDYESFPGFYCNERRQYVSEDVLEKIRSYGTSVTYYGGRILRKENGEFGDFGKTLTKAIMQEIKDDELKNNERRRCRNVQFTNDIDDKNNCTFNNGKCHFRKNKNSNYYYRNENYKFKLLKSNSCSSRMELLGTKTKNQNGIEFANSTQKQTSKMSKIEHDRINETIKNNSTPKIIGEEMKMAINADDITNEISNVKSCKEDINKLKSEKETNDIVDEETLKSSSASKDVTKMRLNYEYQDYDKVVKPRTIDDIEFESYEIAGS